MSKKHEDNWYRWDVMFNNREYGKIVEEIDEMIATGKKVVIGDIIRRDDALKEMGVESLSTCARFKKEVE